VEPAAYPGHPAREQAERRVPARVRSDRLGVAGRLAVDHRARGLGRHVVDRQPGAAGREHESHALVVRQPLQRRHDRLAVVRDQLVLDLQAGLLAQPHERGAGDVLALAVRQRGRDGEHRGP
jgi:hypothetical protein